MSITLMRIPLGAYQTNCYIVGSEAHNHVVIIDPGAEGSQLVQLLQDRQLEPQAILLTHGHSDHIGAVQALVDTYKIPVYIHKRDKEFLSNSELNLSAFNGLHFTVSCDDLREVKQGDQLVFDDIAFKVLETPGHTPGGICFYQPGLVFVGDTLFRDSVGRTDFPNGSFEDLIASIKKQLFVLPDQTVVYPGHGPETRIDYEKMNNPFIS